MIIDSHLHVGTMLHFDMPEAQLIDSMERYQIDFGLVSSVEGVEVDQEQARLPAKRQHTQIELNRRLLELTERHKNRLGALLWVKPLTEGCTPAFERFVDEHHDCIYGLKLHPYHSATPLDHPSVLRYLDFAAERGLPVVTHTAADEGSAPALCRKVAERNPALRLVMYHLGLGTDNREAIDILSELPNLYGDTAWLPPESFWRAYEHCGKERLMFGSDNPISGADTYQHPYNVFYRQELKTQLPAAAYGQLMSGNCARLFGIPKL